ncbi:MAG TPA: nucleoside triphosphate pyrophosphatase [Verrucomicrobiae bacterium]|jgi:septum formation protein|nr:nucleoside triphosphate pyrophosphatase [Verrucomicrobiae bacterium]
MALSTKLFFVYLASKSPRRLSYLRALKIPFGAVVSKHRETHRKSERPEALVVRNARGKALRAVLPSKAPAGARKKTLLVLGADTIVFFNGRVLGKPSSLREAERMLNAMAGKTHDVFSGIALRHPSSGKTWTAFERTRVRLKKWKPAQMRDYAVKAGSLDKAGAYGIQVRPKIVESYRGSYSNVVGLPKELLARMMRKAAREIGSLNAPGRTSV